VAVTNADPISDNLRFFRRRISDALGLAGLTYSVHDETPLFLALKISRRNKKRSYLRLFVGLATPATGADFFKQHLVIELIIF